MRNCWESLKHRLERKAGHLYEVGTRSRQGRNTPKCLRSARLGLELWSEWSEPEEVQQGKANPTGEQV